MREVTFRTAKRYMNMSRHAFMTCMHGNGWKLYRDNDKIIANVTNTPTTIKERNKYGFWGNWWANPSRL